MAVIWNYSPDLAFGGQNTGYPVLTDAFDNGAIIGGSATQFYLKDQVSPQNIVFFHGNFVTSNGLIVSGTITGFDVFFDNPSNKLLATSGYAIDFNAFSQALSQYKASNEIPLNQLILGEPMTVNGSNHPVYPEVVIGGFADDHIFGNDGPNFLYDFGGSDVMYGGPAGDLMISDYGLYGGMPGNDAMYGGEGDDKIAAGGGDDFISGGPGMDAIDGEDGNDTADYSEKTDRLKVKLDGPNEVGVEVAGFVEDTIKNIENINGGSHNDKFVGDGYANQFVGNDGNDKLKGMNGNDVLIGLKGKDKLNGGKDDDLLSGGLRKDVLKGGPGADTFLFDVKVKGRHADMVKDFSHKDVVALNADVFTEVNDSGQLKAKFFVDGKRAKDGNDHVIYHNGVASYDPDGQGGKKAVEFAEFKGNPHLSADDFIIV